MKKGKKIFIAGGHLSPALAVMDEIRRQHPSWTIVFVGRKFAMESDSVASSEYREIMERNIRFLPLYAGRMRKDLSVQTLLSLAKIPFGFLQAVWYCFLERPDIICSFGGYVGFPVVIAGWLFGIRTLTHEQTHVFGLANSLIAPFVDKILLAYHDTRGRYPRAKTVVTGLPLRREFFSPPENPSFTISVKKPILYVTGGTTGALTLNELLFPLVGVLVKTWTVIHQTGQRSLEKAKTIRGQLPAQFRSSYLPVSHLSGGDVSWIMNHMRLLVGRSGANTVAEVSALAKQAVFIPLPWSGKGEQEQNALWYARTGRACVFNQKQVTPEALEKSIMKMMKHGSETGKTILSDERSSSKHIVEIMTSIVESNEK